jgi:hypothetical protein
MSSDKYDATCVDLVALAEHVRCVDYVCRLIQVGSTFARGLVFWVVSRVFHSSVFLVARY